MDISATGWCNIFHVDFSAGFFVLFKALSKARAQLLFLACSMFFLFSYESGRLVSIAGKTLVGRGEGGGVGFEIPRTWTAETPDRRLIAGLSTGIGDGLAMFQK